MWASNSDWAAELVAVADPQESEFVELSARMGSVSDDVSYRLDFKFREAGVSALGGG